MCEGAKLINHISPDFKITVVIRGNLNTMFRHSSTLTANFLTHTSWHPPFFQIIQTTYNNNQDDWGIFRSIHWWTKGWKYCPKNKKDRRWLTRVTTTNKLQQLNSKQYELPNFGLRSEVKKNKKFKSPCHFSRILIQYMQHQNTENKTMTINQILLHLESRSKSSTNKSMNHWDLSIKWPDSQMGL